MGLGAVRSPWLAIICWMDHGESPMAAPVAHNRPKKPRRVECLMTGVRQLWVETNEGPSREEMSSLPTRQIEVSN